MDYDEFSTLSPPTTTSTTLRLYDIFIPLLGVFIISLNLLVVISSGLLLGKRKIAKLFIYVDIAIRWVRIKPDYTRWLCTIKKRRAHPRLLLVSLFLGQQPRSTYLFLGNVGMSDLLTGVAVLFGQLYPRSLRTDVSCAIQGNFSLMPRAQLSAGSLADEA
jgi:hypothetical protein